MCPKSLVPDQAEHFVWPDLGLGYKGYQQMTLADKVSRINSKF